MADDTVALQNGLKDLGSPGHSPVLFLPSGTYRITRSLVLASAINVSVVGEDPATTTIIWDGAAAGTMLSVNGVAYSRFTRLTFDGTRTASVAVEQSWDHLHPYFDTGNEYSDDYFTDVEYGIRGGFRGHGFAETSIVRSHFVRNTKAGVALGNFNALDIWVWYSTFDDCGVGVTNGTGAGNFHVYNSVFRRSAVADLYMQNTGGFSARGNYSTGSRAFFLSGGATNNPATIHIQNNTVVDPTNSLVMSFGNQGPGLITDNVIRSLPGATGPVISWVSFLDADVASIGNTFTVADPIRNNGRLISIDDRVVARSLLNPREPALPEALPNLNRQVFEVPAGASSGAIQQAITAAVANTGRRSVVHIPYGTYAISQTLTIPASDVQLIGDGFGTVLRWIGSDSGPLIKLIGPSKVTLRELQVDGATTSDGIVVDNVDQVGSRVYMGGVQLRSGNQTDLFVNGLDNTNVQLEDVGYAYSPNGVSIKVTGGPLSAVGRKTSGKTTIFSGASSGNRVSYEVSGGAKVLVRDVWYESGAGAGFANVQDRAVFTVDGARIASPANQIPAAFNIISLNGTVAIVASHLDDRITVSGNGSSANVLAVGIFDEQPSADYFLNSTSPLARALRINSRHRATLPGNRSVPSLNLGEADPLFIKAMLDHTRREHPETLSALPAGTTDVRMFRVWVTNGRNNIMLSAR